MLQRNDLIKFDGNTYRILDITTKGYYVINCNNHKMPELLQAKEYQVLSQNDLEKNFLTVEMLTPKKRAEALRRYSLIAPAIAVVSNERRRNEMIEIASKQSGLSKQTIRSYLRLFLIYQSVSVLSPKDKPARTELTSDEKNMRWALNKYFYNPKKNTLPMAYRMLLKEKYCDSVGKLQEAYPTFNQFRYFYRKTRKLENFHITREGIKNYQRNSRPLIGDGVQEYAPNIGIAMLDSTVCDIFLVNDRGQLVGRPILVAAVDVNTSLCLGYSLLWEGGVYSLQQLMLNIITDKQTLCRTLGIEITEDQWNVNELPGVMITDLGSEYAGNTFEQITELGITLINLPAYRPELKGVIEKFFDVAQDLYKDILKGKGVIMPDFQERGAHDYRKDACLTMKDFEKILVKCIVHYNSERLLENYPYTEAMLMEEIKPYASAIWNYKYKEPGANIVTISKPDLIITLLPRTTGKFTRYGLKVNNLRYHAEGFKEEYLRGGDATVAYNPDDTSSVWMKYKDGSFKRFDLIEQRFREKTLDAVSQIKQTQKKIIKDETEENLQAKIDLLDFIETASNKTAPKNIKIKGSGEIRKAECKKIHKDLGGDLNGK